MTEDDFKFIPHSDMGISDRTIVNQHQNLINTNQFDDATALLDNNNYSKGFRASIFNSMHDKLRTIQEYLQTKETENSDEVISSTEPSGDCTFWLADY